MDITELNRQKSTKRHPWEEARVGIIKKLIKRHLKAPNHIVDIGGGDAFVIKNLCQNKIGNQFTAIDIAYTDALLKQINTGDCIINFLTQIPEKLDPKADCILLMDVLEHCADDGALLQKSKSLSTAETLYFITVPAFQGLFSEHDTLLHHHRRYSETELKNLCKRNGLVVIESGYFFSSLLLVRSIQLLLEKTGLRKPKKTIDNWNGGNRITAAFNQVLQTDYFVSRATSKLGIHLPGLSSYCVCHPLP